MSRWKGKIQLPVHKKLNKHGWGVVGGYWGRGEAPECEKTRDHQVKIHKCEWQAGGPYDSVTDQSENVLKISVESYSTVTFETCKVVLSAQFRHILCLNQ